MTLLQRSFQRAVVFLSDHCEVLTKAGAKNLQVALQTKTMQELPVSTFSRVFLESYTEQLSREQMEAIALWEKNLCEFSTADRAALSARFVRVQEFLAKFADEIVILQKPNLRSVVMSNQAHKHAEWAQAPNLFRRDYAFLTEEGICLLEDWELVLCDTSVAFLPRVHGDECGKCCGRVGGFSASTGAEFGKGDGRVGGFSTPTGAEFWKGEGICS